MLSGFQIIEIEGLGPAPFASMMFADLGAEVTVVRCQQSSMPNKPERNLLDRGKRSIALSLKSESDLGVIKQLVANADGLIEGFRPGVMERLGLGPDVLKEKNSRLVYGRLSGVVTGAQFKLVVVRDSVTCLLPVQINYNLAKNLSPGNRRERF